MDSFLGLLLLLGYIVFVVGLSAAVTWAVVKISPTKSRPEEQKT